MVETKSAQVSFSKTSTKIWKVIKTWPKAIQLCRWTGCIIMPNLKPFSHYILDRCPEHQICHISPSVYWSKIRKRTEYEQKTGRTEFLPWLVMSWLLALPGHQQPCHGLCSITGPLSSLTHWGRVTHICASKLKIIGSDNGLSPGRRQTIIWTNTGILLVGPLGTNFS